MERRQVRPADKAQAAAYARAALEQTWNCAAEQIKYVGGGSFGYVYRAKLRREPGTVILKACRAEGIYAQEAAALRLLGEKTLIPVPEVYFTFAAGKSVPMDFICMQDMPGTDCFTDFKKLLCSKKQKAAFADAVTDALGCWHARTNGTFGLIGSAGYSRWTDYYRPFAAETLRQARTLTHTGRLEPRALTAMERAWEAFPVIFREEVKTASLVHGDVNVMNILSDRRLRPTAIIDPLETKWADREYELFQLRNLTGDRFGLYGAYKNKFPVSLACDLKTAFYALYHEVYAYVLSGVKADFILKPLVRRMEAALSEIR